MPLLGALVFLAAFECVRRERCWLIFWLPLLLLVGAQVHMSTLSLILPLAGFFWLARVRVNWPWLVGGTLAAVACYLPYLLGDARHDWANTRGIITGGHGGFSADALKVFTSPFTFLVNFWNPGWTYGPGDYAELARRAFGSQVGLVVINAISVVFAAGLVAGVGMAWRLEGLSRRAAWRERLAAKPGLAAVLFLFLAYLVFNLAAGKPFHSRYCLLVAPLLFTLTGVGAARCLTVAGSRRFFLPAMGITVVANLWFMPVISRFEGDRIDHGAVLVPSYRKMEAIYQQLEAYAPGTVVIQDQDYLAAIPPGEKNKIYLHAGLVRRYVAARQIQQPPPGGATTNFYILKAASQVAANTPGVAFQGNGIALVAWPH